MAALAALETHCSGYTVPYGTTVLGITLFWLNSALRHYLARTVNSG